MMDLECQKCGFKITKDRIPSRCPYCAKEGTLGLSKSAQDILDEAVGEY